MPLLLSFVVVVVIAVVVVVVIIIIVVVVIVVIVVVVVVIIIHWYSGELLCVSLRQQAQCGGPRVVTGFQKRIDGLSLLIGFLYMNAGITY